MDLIAAKLGAKMAINALEASGQIGGEGGKTTIELSKENYDAELERDIVGVSITDYAKDRRKLVLPAERPAATLDAAFVASGNGNKLGMSYSTYGDYLSKPCFLMTDVLLGWGCPFFWSEENSVYDSLLYAYETTTDNLGIGITFQKGWYALSSTTFANKAISAEECPVYILGSMGQFMAATEEAKAFFEGCFPLAESETFTVKQENLYEISNGEYMVMNADVSDVGTPDAEYFAFSWPWIAVVIWTGAIKTAAICSSYEATDIKASLSYSGGLTTIDPKYLPGLETLALNGADGRQYRLSVDANGALAVTAV